MIQQDNCFVQKHFITNSNIPLPIMEIQLEHHSHVKQIAFLENIVNVASAMISDLKAEEAKKAQLYTQQLLNSLNDIAPIIPKLDYRNLNQAYLYKDSPEINSSPSTSLSSPKNNASITEKKAEKPSAKSAKMNSDSDSEGSQKGPKCAQSKFKNSYGLSMGKVIKSVNEYHKLVQKGKLHEIIEGSRHYYIHMRIGSYPNSQKERFENYLKGYYTRSESEKKNRGKGIAYKFLEQDVSQGLILVELIQDFLDESNPDFQNYICNETRTKKQMSNVLSEEKNVNQLRNSFKEMQFHLEQKFQSMKIESL